MNEILARKRQQDQSPALASRAVSALSGLGAGAAANAAGMGKFFEGMEAPNQQQGQPATNQAQENIIEQVSPELHDFIKYQILQGRSPIEAGAIAQNDKRFTPIISKLQKLAKANWSDILQTIYGNLQGQQQQTQTPAAQQMQPAQGQATANLMAALQAAAQARQRRQSV